MVGASPSFSEGHVIRTLILISGNEIGRKKLVRILGVGEGSVRTILKRLKKEGFIKSGRMGQLLSEKGGSYVQNLFKYFTAPKEFGPVKNGGFESVIIVHERADRIKTGFEQRDIAVNAGSEGVLVLNYKNGKLEFPTSDVKLSDFPDLIEKLKGFRFRENDVAIIAFAGTYPKAEDGAIAVAMNLIEG